MYDSTIERIDFIIEQNFCQKSELSNRETLSV